MDTRSETERKIYTRRGVPGIRYSVALPEDDEDMRAALRENTMGSWIELTFEREPSYFADSETPCESVPMIARSGSTARDLVGLYGAEFMKVRVNGAPAEACYLGGLRLCMRYRGRPGIVKGGFESIPHLLPKVKDSAIVFTSVASENGIARRFLERGLSGMPKYALLGEMETFAIGTGRRKNYGLLERAALDDAPEVARFYNETRWNAQLSPVLDEKWLHARGCDGKPMIEKFLLHRREGRIAACVAVWDRRPHRQIVVRGYRKPLRKLRPACNILARLLRRPKLPTPGERLEQVFFSFIALAPCASGKKFFTRMIREALCEARSLGADSAVLGLSASSPHGETLRRSFKPYIYRTRIQSVALAGCPTPPELSGTIEPEVALL